MYTHIYTYYGILFNFTINSRYIRIPICLRYTDTIIKLIRLSINGYNRRGNLRKFYLKWIGIIYRKLRINSVFK